MKNLFLITVPCLIGAWVLLGSTHILHAQSNNNMGIGTTSPDASAILDIKSTTKGLLIPRLTQGQENALSGPASGLLIFNTGQGRLNFYNAGWKPVSPWSLNGSNAYYSAGNVETTGNLLLNNASPTLYLQDTDNKSGMIHQNSNTMFFLTGSGNNSTTWVQNGSFWPLTLNMTNDAATFGGPAYFMEGNVGIGTSSPTTAKLVINRGSGLVGLDLASTDAYAEMRVIRNSLFGSDNNLYLGLGAASGANTYLYSGGTNPVMTLTGGKVGIGTTNPLSKLSISPSVTEPKITLWDGGSTTNHYGFGVSGGQLNYHVAGSNDSHVFYAGGKNGNGAELMRIKGNGLVGIGTNNPQQALQVIGRVAFNQSGEPWWALDGNGSVLTFTNQGHVGGVSNINYNTGCYFCLSDGRLKDNITPLSAVLPSLMKLAAKTYTMKSDPNKELNIGFIAQEVEPLFPEFIMAPSGSEEENSFYKMNYAGFGVIAVKAIQEQQQIIESQAKKIEAQQAEIDAIKKALGKAGIKLD